MQEAALASTPSKRTEGIVSRVHEAMDVGVCSLYMANEEGVLTLVATKVRATADRPCVAVRVPGRAGLG